VEDRVDEERLRRFFEDVAKVSGYDFDDLDWDAVEVGIGGTDAAAETRFSYDLAGRRPVTVEVARDACTCVFVVCVTGDSEVEAELAASRRRREQLDERLRPLADHVGGWLFEEACRWAWRTAAGTGKPGRFQQWPGEVADVPLELEEFIWCRGAAPWSERLALALALYREMPCYANTKFAYSFSEWDDETRQGCWSEYRSLISDEDDRLADPIAYSLWCDRFESAATVEDAWREVAQPQLLTERGLERLLAVAGPVPYRLKAPLYEQLVADQRWHVPIFRSLLYSAFDYFGELDVEAARSLLARLELPGTTEGLAELKRKLHA
jgi:hypothetical protein